MKKALKGYLQAFGRFEPILLGKKLFYLFEYRVGVRN